MPVESAQPSGAEEHTPVLLREALAGLAVRPGDWDIDGTVGLGGHARAILRASGPGGRLLGIDADPDALGIAHQRLKEFGDRAILVRGNYRKIRELAAGAGFARVDGILLDLGVSSLQFGARGRGFSIRHDAPLDMRMDPAEPVTAADLVNHLSEAELADIIFRYGEEPRARLAARAIVRQRPIQRTAELALLLQQTLGRAGSRIHAATRTFQALRIAVNHEIESLAGALPDLLALLRPGGRLVIISFHSLEDRAVKQFFQHERRDCVCPPALPACVCAHRATIRLIGSGVTKPSAAEIASNPRSRSARMRVAQRL